MFIALAMTLSLTAPDTMLLTFVHGDEQVVSWLDRASIRRTGDKVRSRTLRIRHADQSFWLAEEIDCAADTTALIIAANVQGDAATPPSLEGEAWHRPIRRYDRFSQAVRDAVCDETYVNAAVRPVQGVAAAVAVLDATHQAAVRARPLELVVVRGGAAPVLLDRATLDGGGPQWEIRSLKMAGERGLWTWWEFDCSGAAHMAADLRWSAPMTRGGGYGTRTYDREPVGPVVAGSERAAIKDVACAGDIWDREVHSSLDAALRAATANPG